MLDSPFEVTVLNLRVSMELYDKCLFSRQRRLVFIHSIPVPTVKSGRTVHAYHIHNAAIIGSAAVQR